MKKSVKNKLKEETKKYSEDEENYTLYTKLSHEEICRNTEIYNAKKEKSIDIAKKLLGMGAISIDKICEATGLSKKEILSLKD